MGKHDEDAMSSDASGERNGETEAGESDSAGSSTEEAAPAAGGSNQRSRLSNRAVGQANRINLYKVAKAASDKILASTADKEARRRMVEMVEKTVLSKREFEHIGLGSAVLRSLKTFKPWVDKQVVESDDKEAALIAVQMATLPAEGEGMAQAYKRRTGFSEKGFPDIRERRNKPMEFYPKTQGLYRKTGKPRGKSIPLEESKLAVKVWHEETAPRAQGAGEYCKASPHHPPALI